MDESFDQDQYDGSVGEDDPYDQPGFNESEADAEPDELLFDEGDQDTQDLDAEAIVLDEQQEESSVQEVDEEDVTEDWIDSSEFA
jgi:hypothetical protein